MNNKKFCLLLMAITLLNISLAPAENSTGKNKWTGEVSLGLSMNKGNSDTFNISFTFGLKKRLGNHLEWMNSGFFLFNEEDQVKSAESLGMTSRLNWEHNVKLFTFYEVQIFRDVFKDYKYRIIPGLGIGYKIFKEKQISLRIYAGVSQVMTQSVSKNEFESYTGIKIGNFLAWKITSAAEVKQKCEFISRISDLGSVHIYFETGISAPFSKNLAISVSFLDRYDSHPSTEQIKRNDITLVTGLTLKF